MASQHIWGLSGHWEWPYLKTSCIHHMNDTVAIPNLQPLSCRHWLHELVLKELLLVFCSSLYIQLLQVSYHSRKTSPKLKTIKMTCQSLLRWRMTVTAACQTGSVTHAYWANQPGREPSLAAIAMNLTPPGLQNIPSRNFPFGTSVALAVCAPWWGQFSPHLPLDTQAEKGSFDTGL